MNIIRKKPLNHKVVYPLRKRQLHKIMQLDNVYIHVHAIQVVHIKWAPVYTCNTGALYMYKLVLRALKAVCEYCEMKRK